MSGEGARPRVWLSTCVYEPDHERRRLKQMLDSVLAAGVTDLAIAVDRKSAPGTARWIRSHLRRRRGWLRSIAFPPRITEFVWTDDFAAARNIALDLLPRDCEWWIVVDADDRLERTRDVDLREYLAQLPCEVEEVSLEYVYPDRDGRVFVRHPAPGIFRGPVAYRWTRGWGEYIEPRPKRVVYDAPIRRVHDQDHAIPRLRDRNPVVMRTALAARPDDPDLWWWMAEQHAGLWELDDALTCAQRAIALAKSTRSRYGFLIAAFAIWLRAGMPSEALCAAHDARAMYPDLPEGHILEGWGHFLFGDFEAAIAAMRRGLERLHAVERFEQRQYTGSAVTSTRLYECEPYLVLAESYGQLEQFDDALTNVDLALVGEPPVFIEKHVGALREELRLRRRPPFIGGPTFIDAMAATRRAISAIREYASAREVLAALDDASSRLYELIVPADRELVAQFVETYFAAS